MLFRKRKEKSTDPHDDTRSNVQGQGDVSADHPERAPGGVYHVRVAAFTLGKQMALLLLADIAQTAPTAQLIGVLSATAMRAYFEGAGLPQVATLDHPLGRLFGETFSEACVDAIFDALGDAADRYGLN